LAGKYKNTEVQLEAMGREMQTSTEMKDKEITNIRKDLVKSIEDMERLKREHEEDFRRLVIENEAAVKKSDMKNGQLTAELTEASKEIVAIKSEKINLVSSL
jgi:ribosomal protein L20